MDAVAAAQRQLSESEVVQILGVGYSDEDMRRLDSSEPCEAHFFLMTTSFRTK